MPPRARALLLALLIASAPTGIAAPAEAQERPGPPEPTASDRAAERQALEAIEQLFREGQAEAVIRRVDELAARRPITLDNVHAHFFRAESQAFLGQREAAIHGYESALTAIGVLTDNVGQRQFAWAYFRLALLLRELKRPEVAQARIEEALRLEPRNMHGQLVLGELLVERGLRDRARQHYRDLLATSLPVSEERAVLGIKLDRLGSGKVGESLQPPDLRGAPVHVGLSIALVPLNEVPATVSLPDVCAILESSWRIRCAVLAPLTIPEDAVLAAARGQYDADRLLEEMRTRLPAFARGFTHVVGVTGRDIFARQTNFLFSWQGGDERGGMGVLSAYRFAVAIPDYYEPAIVATRRVALQALSTTGSMLGLPRPTNPECPLAYPNGLREFQQKRLRLCESDVQRRDELLERRGGSPVPFGEQRAEEIARVHRAYYVE